MLVSFYVPEASPQELALRTRIHVARDTARARCERCDSPEGHRIYAVAATIATEWVFRHQVSVDKLREVLEALSRLFLAASVFDRLESESGRLRGS
jgi:hypothetical protein